MEQRKSGSDEYLEWGLADVIGVAAYDTRAHKTVTFLMAATGGPNIHSNRIPLSAADASNTVELTFNGHHVPHTSVLHVRQARQGRLGLADRSVLRINGSLALGVASGSQEIPICSYRRGSRSPGKGEVARVPRNRSRYRHDHPTVHSAGRLCG